LFENDSAATPDKVEALIAGLQTSFSDEREQVVYEMAMALANSRWVPQGLYDRAVKTLGHVGITDVITFFCPSVNHLTSSRTFLRYCYRP
jgi:4-carboxymuconolactone decarboxylase